MKYYLSGAISKQPDFKEYFNWHKNYLATMCGIAEDDIFNPAENDIEAEDYYKSKTWQTYMKWDIKFLTDCDCLILLPNWRKSKGAKIEKWLARKLGIRIVKYNDLVKELINK